MLKDHRLEVSCVRCKQASIKVWWKTRGNRCPKCTREFRGSLGISFVALPSHLFIARMLEALFSKSSAAR